MWWSYWIEVGAWVVGAVCALVVLRNQKTQTEGNWSVHNEGAYYHAWNSLAADARNGARAYRRDDSGARWSFCSALEFRRTKTHSLHFVPAFVPVKLRFMQFLRFLRFVNA